MDNLYNIVIIADFVSSPRETDPVKIEATIRSVFQYLNTEFETDILSNFMVTLKGEVQGLLSCGKNVMRILQYIEFRFYPIKARFGIGIGPTKDVIRKDFILGGEGPAFKTAREMVEEIKKCDRSIRAGNTDVLVYPPFHSEEYYFNINIILKLIAEIKSKWSDRQREVIHACLEHGDNNQKKIAEVLGITQASVSKSLALSSYFTYKEAVAYCSRFFARIT